MPVGQISEYVADSEGVNPKLVPHRVLATGEAIPAIGIGTFGSDNYTSEQIAEAVIGAAAVGYRHFDCAEVYGNEEAVGAALNTVMESGLDRKDIWVTSKVWNDHHDCVEESCRKSLKDLNLNYLDLYLVHWPFPNTHGKGVDAHSRDTHAQSYIHENYMKTWRQMEALVDQGLVQHIGTSNMTIPKLKLLLRDARIIPAVEEMELHPHFQQPAMFEFVVANGMIPIGYSPIGSPSRPDRDRTPDDTVDVDDPVILSIAQRYQIHPAVVCVKWAVQRGQIPIPFSVKRSQYLNTLKAVVSAPLTDQEMAAIARIDKENRLIKGHVFLWKDDQTWEALWDQNGQITPA